MDAQRTRNIMLADARGHQQQRFSSTYHTLFGLRRANRRFHRLSLLGRQWQRLRTGAAVRSLHPGLRIDHPFPLHHTDSFGQIFAERY